MRAIAVECGRHSDIQMRVCFKRTRDFRLDGRLVALFDGLDVSFQDRASPGLLSALAWADVVHLQGPSPDVIASAKVLRKPIAVTLHAWRRPGRAPGQILRRLLLDVADERWFDSQFVWDTWETGVKRRGSRRVHPVSHLPTPPVASPLRRGFAFVGRWIPNKGIEDLVEAYALAGLDPSAWPLTLMGEGPLLDPIRTWIGSRGLEGIRVLGFVTDADKAREIAAAKWMVVPPHTREDFGLTAVEARSLGVPCIITRDGGLPEAAGREALVCEPGDARGLARLMRQAAGMPEDEYLGRAARTRAELDEQLVPISFYPEAYRRLSVR